MRRNKKVKFNWIIRGKRTGKFWFDMVRMLAMVIAFSLSRQKPQIIAFWSLNTANTRRKQRQHSNNFNKYQTVENRNIKQQKATKNIYIDIVCSTMGYKTVKTISAEIKIISFLFCWHSEQPFVLYWKERGWLRRNRLRLFPLHTCVIRYFGTPSQI